MNHTVKKAARPLALLSLLFMFFIVLNSGFAENDKVLIKVDPGKIVAEIKPAAIGGVNVNNAMMIIKLKKMIDPLKIPTITFPAGNIADDEVGDTNSDVSLSNFKKQQERLGNPFTFVQVRVYKGTAEGSAEAVRRAAANKVKVDVWSIGNEPDLYSPNKGDHSWTKEKYAQTFREFVTAMRAVDPNIKVAGPLTCQPNDEWIKYFITQCGDLVDVLAWHWYPTDGKASDEKALATAPDIIEQIKRYRSWLKDPAINPKGYNREIKLAVTEYAIHWNTPVFRQLTDMVGAAWTAEVMGYMAQYGLDYSHYFCLGAYGGHAIFEDGPSYMERPVYYVFLFYANHFGRTMVDSSSSDNSVKVFASKDEKGGNYLMLINKSPDTSKEITVEPAGIQIARAEGHIVDNDKSGDQLDADSLRIVNGRLQIVLPPYSVVSVEYR